MSQSKEGIVLQAVSGVYTVQCSDLADSQDDSGPSTELRRHGNPIIHCTLRGNLKKDLHYSTSDSFSKRVTHAKRNNVNDTVSVGDRVLYVEAKQGAGVIEEILPRRSRFSRAGFRGREQTLVCNLDQVFIVFAAAEPNPDPWKVDRFLAAAEHEGLDAILVANKVDLLPEAAVSEFFAEWTAIGYPLVRTSAKRGIGIDDLKERLQDRVSAFVGPSGAGKSSLLNRLQPELDLKTGDIGYVTYKGRHTTTAAQLLPLDSGGWVADTPGLRQLDLFEAGSEDIEHLFPEFRLLIGKCRFDNCRHNTEPGCAIKEAVGAGAVSRRRYESFRILVGELEPAHR